MLELFTKVEFYAWFEGYYRDVGDKKVLRRMVQPYACDISSDEGQKQQEQQTRKEPSFVEVFQVAKEWLSTMLRQMVQVQPYLCDLNENLSRIQFGHSQSAPISCSSDVANCPQLGLYALAHPHLHLELIRGTGDVQKQQKQQTRKMPSFVIELFQVFKKLLSTMVRVDSPDNDLLLFKLFKSCMNVELILSDRQKNFSIKYANYKKIKDYHKMRCRHLEQQLWQRKDENKNDNQHQSIGRPASSKTVDVLPNIITDLYSRLKLRRYDVLRSDKDQWIGMWSLRSSNTEVERWLSEQCNGRSNVNDVQLFLPYGVNLLDHMMKQQSDVIELDLEHRSRPPSGSNNHHSSLVRPPLTFAPVVKWVELTLLYKEAIEEEGHSTSTTRVAPFTDNKVEEIDDDTDDTDCVMLNGDMTTTASGCQQADHQPSSSSACRSG